MGWSFRKSMSFGPLRLNFSKSGIGASVGVKGARVRFTKRGTYVNLGSNGIYYRQRIDTADKPSIIPPSPIEHLNPEAATITSGDIEKITDVDSREFIKELEEKTNKIALLPFGIWLSCGFFILGLVWLNQDIKMEEQYGDFFTIIPEAVHIRKEPSQKSEAIGRGVRYEKYAVASIDSTGWLKIYESHNPEVTGFIRADLGELSRELVSKKTQSRNKLYPVLNFLFGGLCILLIPACVYLSRKDRERKTIELTYSIDEAVKQLHDQFLATFRSFSSIRKVWQKIRSHRTTNTKYHAGASELVSRVGVSAIYNHKLPSSFLKTNVSVPCIHLRNTELYFFPERLILKQGNKFGATFYKNITVSSSPVRFIEEEGVAADATIVDHTWKYTNKSGGPDRRFSDNRQIPICLYTDYEFYSETGVNEVITTSKTGGMDEFADFIHVIGNFQRSLQG